MEEKTQALQQNAYPSASAFDQQAGGTGAEPVVDADAFDAFGARAGLPGLSSGSLAKPRLRLQTQHPHSLPVVKPEQVADVFGPAPEVQEAPALTTAIPLISAENTRAEGIQQAAYPSASPTTEDISKPAYKPRLPKIRPGVRDSLKSMVQANQSLTVPIRGVARVAQRQFTMAAKVNQDRFVREQEEARQVLNFTVRLAETMFHYGADTMDVDSAIVAVCSTYGLDDVEVDVTGQSILINYVSDISVDSESKHLFSSFGAKTSERFTHTVVRVVRSNSENYSSLESVYRLIHAITEKGLEREQAQRQLTEINTRKKLYPPLAILGFNLLMAVSFTFGVGGSWRAATVSFFVFLAVHFATLWVSRLKLPGFFSMVVGSGVITAAAMYVTHESSLATSLGFYVSGPHVVAAGLMMLLPTAKLVSAAQDALTGYPLTASGKFVVTGIGFVGLVVGIAVALTVMNYFDAVSMDIQQAVFNPPPLWVSVVGMALGSVTVAAAFQGTWKNMLWVVLVSLLGQGVYYGMSFFLQVEPGMINVALGAFTVGVASAVLAFRMHSPQLIFAVPGIMFLLPGLKIFRGLYSMVIDSTPLAGFSNILDASATILTLSAGVILGIYLTQNVLQRMVGKHQEHRDAVASEKSEIDF